MYDCPPSSEKSLRRGHLQGFSTFQKNNLGQRLSPLSLRRKAGDPMTENRQNKQELFQIGEVCKAMGLSRRILLNYEELGLLTPATAAGGTRASGTIPPTIWRTSASSATCRSWGFPVG